ncbi:PepSY domain-containing protein [Pusillimonas sp. CC-YST705]|uniref:PepSY domain-containing protein n=1 Tax=Mesopusillimonas faecipullorum TaxID=2755040 RepID=A0ABS8C813_9BURK|nr:PepSY-associated TM helix domain-containing protein [Mesopusillimonas faecipullorum]MCB5362173.1 PepSY domain-containing protein [Mesopusillimonas faecipullorum]
MRNFALLLHRWAGLFIAVFLIVAGLTGAVISWDHAIDEWLNRDLFMTESSGPTKSPLELAEVVEAHDSRAQVIYLPLHAEPGHTMVFMVAPRKDAASGKPFELGYDEVFIDLVTAQVVGTRNAGEVSLSWRTLMPFLRQLHESLHMPAPENWPRLGYQFMGIVALVWFLDAFVAVYLTLPRKLSKGWMQRWWQAWRVRWAGGSYKLNFDFHRAFGLWTWILVLIIAFTSFSLNLYREVFHPAMSLVSQVTPSPFVSRPFSPTPIEPEISFGEILTLATKAAQEKNWDRPPGGIFYARDLGFYSVAYFHEDAEDGNGMEIANMYFDGKDAAYLGEHLPWHGTAADVFTQLQFPLHSGRILGLPGRILMSVMGLVVAMLSVTGIIIWARKRRARKLAVG